MTKSKTILYSNGEDEAFIAEVPELAALRKNAAPQTTPTRNEGKEALANAEIVIAEWLQTRELSRPIPETRGRPLFA